MKRQRYYICDVFTRERFGGNQLAVFPDANGLNPDQMQKIAREFNFSETSFVFPPENGNTRKVRIFTPSIEVPFAGHPNIGTAFVLSSIGELEDQKKDIVFEERAGLVSIHLTRQSDDRLRIRLDAPERLTTGRTIPVENIAKALSLSVYDIETANHDPIVASVGLPFIFVELKELAALRNVKVNMDGFADVASHNVSPDIHVYLKSKDQYDIRARMFAPFDGVLEDPATGSANCALAGLLALSDNQTTSEHTFKITQGVELGRPSLLEALAKKEDGVVVSTSVCGECVLVSEGYLYIEQN